MKNLKFMTIAVLLHTTALCTATITLEFERGPGNNRPGQTPAQNNFQNGVSQPQAVGSSQIYSQQSPPSQNQQSSYVVSHQQQPITSASSSSQSTTTFIQPSIYNPPNSPFPSFNSNPTFSQSGGNNGPFTTTYHSNNNNNNNVYQPQSSASGQHPFATYNHPNSIQSNDPNKPVRVNLGPSSFVSLLLGSMGLHGLSNNLFGRNGPRPNRPPKNGQLRQQQQQHGQQPQNHFNNHYSAIQGVSQQQHHQQVQIQSVPYNSIPVSSPSTSQSQQSPQIIYTQVESSNPTDYLPGAGPTGHGSSTQSYFEHQHQQQSDRNNHHQPQVTQTVQAYTQGGVGGGNNNNNHHNSYIPDQGTAPSSHFTTENQGQAPGKPYTIIEKPVVHYVEKPVIRFIEKTVVRTVEKPVIKYVEKPPRRISGKDGEPYAAESSIVNENASVQPNSQAESNDDYEVVHHNYPPRHTTLHHQEPSEYYSAYAGDQYYRKPNGEEGQQQQQQQPQQHQHQHQHQQQQQLQQQAQEQHGHQNTALKSRRSSSGSIEQISHEENPFQMPKKVPAYSPSPNYKLIKTNSFGPLVSGEGLDMSAIGVSKRAGSAEARDVDSGRKKSRGSHSSDKRSNRSREVFLDMD